MVSRKFIKHSSLLTDPASKLHVCKLGAGEKKEGYLTHGVDALTEASDEGRRRLR